MKTRVSFGYFVSYCRLISTNGNVIYAASLKNNVLGKFPVNITFINILSNVNVPFNVHEIDEPPLLSD